MADFELPKLTYGLADLAPSIGEETMRFNYEKHNRICVGKLNVLVKGTRFDGFGLKQIVREAQGELFDYAGQSLNYAYFWSSLTPNGGGQPSGDLARAIQQKWGSYDAFSEAFLREAETLFGSGWVWLCRTSAGAVSIVSTSNADSPVRDGLLKPLLCLDVWEHAYYLDYRNDKKAYVQAFLSKLINWKFAEYRYNGGPFDYVN